MEECGSDLLHAVTKVLRESESFCRGRGLGSGGEENKGEKRLICGYNFRVAENTTPITGFAFVDCRKRSFIIILDTETTVTALMSTGRTDNASSRQMKLRCCRAPLILFGRYVTLTSQSQPGLAYGWRNITSFARLVRKPG